MKTYQNHGKPMRNVGMIFGVPKDFQGFTAPKIVKYHSIPISELFRDRLQPPVDHHNYQYQESPSTLEDKMHEVKYDR